MGLLRFKGKGIRDRGKGDMVCNALIPYPLIYIHTGSVYIPNTSFITFTISPSVA